MRNGELLFVALLIISGLILDSRQHAVPHLPAVDVSGQEGTACVILHDGCRQLIDACSGLAVNELTRLDGTADEKVQDRDLSVVTVCNSMINIPSQEIGGQEVVPAGARLALGIRLHPDLMGSTDWEVLPGIGPVRGAAIVEDRQKNGEFGCIDQVQRVKGIGKKRLETMKPFFVECNSTLNKEKLSIPLRR